LAAIEAEIQAHLHDQQACLSALDAAEDIQDAQERRYNTDFDRIKLAGYKGACYQLLYDPEETSTRMFLTQAQTSLQEALASLNPMLLQWQSSTHTDLAGTYARQGNLEQAYIHASQAITVVVQTKKPVHVQRLLTLRQTLEPWKETQYVKDLDEQMAPLLVPRWYRGNV
jgi:hypothetical protein